MPCCSQGRSYRKFYSKPPETLQTVTERGNTSTQSVEFQGNVETYGFFIGDGSQLTNIPPQSSITLETTVYNGNTATHGAYFGGDLEATGFLIGDGSQLTNIPPQSSITLETTVDNGNTATQGAYFGGDVEATGFFIGDGSQLTNIPPQSSITLETTVDNGNTATQGAYFGGDVEATGFLIGDGSQLQNLPAAPDITLQTVIANGNSATQGAYFTGDLEASGYLIGDGSQLQNLPIPTLDAILLNDNVATQGAYFTGDLEVSGYLIGDGSLIQNLPTPTLDNVLLNDNVATQGAYFTGDVEASGYLIGDGSQLQNLPIPTLQDVTTQDSTTSDKITFSNPITSLEASGNVVVNGNVTALEFFGDGSELTSLVPPSQLDDNSSRINTLNQKVIITNTNGITTNFTKGDILYASSSGTLSKLAISSTQGEVLSVNASGVPEWSASPDVSSIDNRISSLESNIMVTSTTGITGIQTGDILYASATNTLTRLPKGASGQFLAINSSGIPQWVNGPGASTQFITESYVSSRTARLGFHNTNPLHAISFGTSYYDENLSTGAANLVISGNVFAEFYYGDGSRLTNITVSQTSDARAKSNASIIVNSLDTLSKLKPVMYDKDGVEESGFIAQDIYYDAPELRHLVELGKDANPNETKNEPNYEDWGEDHAKLDYVGLIAYTVAAINELREMVEELENA